MGKDFVLSADNYYSQEANERYMSFHTYLSYAGHILSGCEAKAEAMRKGEWVEPKTKAMMVGSYVDSAIEGTLEEFRRDNPDIFLKDGKTLKAEYRQAEMMLSRMKEDKYFMSTLSGKKQVIMTGELFGVDWKIKIDSYIPHRAIVDLKTTSNLHKAWKVDNNQWASVPEYYFYTGQLALYQKIVEINTGEKLPCYLSFVTKEDTPELCVANIDQETLDKALEEIKENIESVMMVRKGEVQPIRCEKCDYCKTTKVLKNAISMYDLIEV